MRSWRSSSPTDLSDVARRFKRARRLGSARMAKADSMCVYSRTGICLSRHLSSGPGGSPFGASGASREAVVDCELWNRRSPRPPPLPPNTLSAPASTGPPPPRRAEPPVARPLATAQRTDIRSRVANATASARGSSLLRHANPSSPHVGEPGPSTRSELVLAHASRLIGELLVLDHRPQGAVAAQPRSPRSSGAGTLPTSLSHLLHRAAA